MMNRGTHHSRKSDLLQLGQNLLKRIQLSQRTTELTEIGLSKKISKANSGMTGMVCISQTWRASAGPCVVSGSGTTWGSVEWCWPSPPTTTFWATLKSSGPTWIHWASWQPTFKISRHSFHYIPFIPFIHPASIIGLLMEKFRDFHQ